MSKIVVVLDEREFPIRATPLAKLGPLFPALSKLDVTGESADGMAEAARALGEVVFHGIRRAGGDVTQEFVHENIDFTNLGAVFQVVAKVNGLVPKDAGQGEAGAGTAS